MTDYVQCLINLLKNYENEQNVNLKLFFEMFLAKFISSVIIGLDVNCIANEKFILDLLRKIEEDLTSMKGKIKIILLTHFPKFSRIMRIKVINPAIYRSFVKHLTENENFENNFTEKSLLRFMINHKLINTELQSQTLNLKGVLAFIIDGFFLTTKLFEACCYEIAVNEDIQQELRESVFKSTFFNDSKFLHNFVLETSRKWPIISNINRICNKNCTIELRNGERFKFNSGDLIKIPIKLINNDPKIFSNPFDIYVNRFDDPNDCSLLSFGIGKKACFCSEFAISLIKSSLYVILQKYEVSLSGNNYSQPIFCNDFEKSFVLKKIKTLCTT